MTLENMQYKSVFSEWMEVNGVSPTKASAFCLKSLSRSHTGEGKSSKAWQSVQKTQIRLWEGCGTFSLWSMASKMQELCGEALGNFRRFSPSLLPCAKGAQAQNEIPRGQTKSLYWGTSKLNNSWNLDMAERHLSFNYKNGKSLLKTLDILQISQSCLLE